jgi:hypothetical protein
MLDVLIGFDRLMASRRAYAHGLPARQITQSTLLTIFSLTGRAAAGTC